MSYKALGLDDIFAFGKFKGQQVEDVIEDSPGYVRWLCENTDCAFDEEALQSLEKREARKQ